MLRFQTLGSIDLRREDGERLDELLDQPKRLALLAYMAACQPSGPVRREQVISVLWPDSSPTSARQALSTTLTRLRNTIGDDLLRGRGEETIALSAEDFRSDVTEFQRALEEGRFRAAVGLYGGPFLEGFRPPDARSFEEWVLRRRDEYARRAYRAAMSAAEEAREAEEWRAAETCLRKAREIEPLREEATRELLELLARRGDRASALEVYDRFRGRLDEEAGLSPSEGLVSLARRLQSGADGDRSPPSSAADAPGTTAVAVLPFEELGRDRATPLTEGMHDALLTRLSNISGLTVISRTSVQQYRQTDRTTAEIARDLGVEWIVEGSVQEMGDSIQVNAQLIDPGSSANAWAESYRRNLTAEELFALQTEITKKIARSLETKLTSEERKRVERLPSKDLTAYRLYAQGKAQLAQRTETGMRAALRAFEEAIQHDREYAPAWSGLADARTLLWDHGLTQSDHALEKAQTAAERSLALDPSLAEGYASLGLVETFRSHDGPGALRLLERSVQLKPSYAQGYLWTSYVEAAVGRLESSVRHLERASELDPTAPVVAAALAHAYFMSRRLSDAMQSAERARELAPEYAAAHLFVGQIHTARGRPAEAIASIERGLEYANSRVRRRHLRYLAWLSVACARAGDVGRARDVLRRIQEGDDRFAEGAARVALGDAEGAFAAFDRADWSPMHAMNLRFHPALDPIRDDSRFEELLRHINQRWGLRVDGSLPVEDGAEAIPPSAL